MAKCERCGKEYLVPNCGNWLKGGVVGKRHGSVPSDRFCSYKCGRENSVELRRNKLGKEYSPFCDPEVRKKSQQTMMEKYGYTNPAYRNPKRIVKPRIVKPKRVPTVHVEDFGIVYEMLDRIGVEYIKSDDGMDFTVGELCFKLGQSFEYVCENEQLCRKKHIILITNDKVETRDLIGRPNGTKSNGLKYLHKCPEPLIGVDIELFNGPEFPYRSDRPKCFYNTRVNNQRSMREAWDDEKLRWNMIINRIQYSGGFIDANGIVNALNITRKCKQPSWFSKNYAKELIEEFVTTGVIVDGFAGYGMRHDAAIEMGLEYHGIDFNEELVKWHHECNRNIEYADANTWKKTINKPHSVLICPPYTDYEVYFDGQDVEKTQEDWLDVMMKNYPNATEYIMVCKIVDRYADNVVTQKNNNGVIGKNVEKVIVIKNPSN